MNLFNTYYIIVTIRYVLVFFIIVFLPLLYMYIFELSPPLASSTSSFFQWHYRLGHLCGSRLSALLHRGLLGSVSGRESLNHCQSCRKQIHLPYHSSESVSQRPFDFVHLDV
jgi:hypothetical protein